MVFYCFAKVLSKFVRFAIMFFKTACFAKVLSKYICVSLALKMEKVKARGMTPYSYVSGMAPYSYVCFLSTARKILNVLITKKTKVKKVKS